jgi:hypothetical protein
MTFSSDLVWNQIWKSASLKALSAVLLLFSGLFFLPVAGAVPTGDKESFMANTGIALSGSVGSVLYNPANLTSTSTSRLSANTSSFFYTSSSERDDTSLLQSPGFLGHQQVFSGSGSIPGLLATVFKLESGAIALSINTPARSDITYSYYSPASSLQPTLTGNMTITSRSTMDGTDLGFSYAKEVSPGLSLGASGFLGRNVTVSETQLAYKSLNTGDGETRYNLLHEETLRMRASLGAAYATNSWLRWPLRLGMRIDIPQWAFNDDTSYRSSTTSFLGGTNASVDTESGARLHPGTPWVFALGTSVEIKPKMQLLLDVSYNLEYSSQAVSLSTGAAETVMSPSFGDAGLAVVTQMWPETQVRFGYRYGQDFQPYYDAFEVRSQRWIASGGFNTVTGKLNSGVGLYYESQNQDKNSDGIFLSGSHRTETDFIGLLVSAEYSF